MLVCEVPQSFSVELGWYRGFIRPFPVVLERDFFIVSFILISVNKYFDLWPGFKKKIGGNANESITKIQQIFIRLHFSGGNRHRHRNIYRPKYDGLGKPSTVYRPCFQQVHQSVHYHWYHHVQYGTHSDHRRFQDFSTETFRYLRRRTGTISDYAISRICTDKSSAAS